MGANAGKLKWKTPPYLTQYELGEDGDTGWGIPGNNPAYDAWGYKPAGLKTPTQMTYTTYFSESPEAANYPPKGQTFDQYGITSSHLAVWGSKNPWIWQAPYTKILLDNSDIGWNDGDNAQPVGNTWPSAEWNVAFGASNGDGVIRQPWMNPVLENWERFRNNPGPQTICQPDTYPNCDMTTMTMAEPAVQLYDGTAVGGIQSWKKGITDAYNKAYVNGGFDAIQDGVNSTDPSASDPCEGPGYLAKMANAGLAVGALAVYSLLIDPELRDLITPEQRFGLAMGTMLGTFWWANSADEDFGDPETNAMWAEQALGIPIAWSFFDYAQRRYYWNFPTPMPLLIGAGISYLFLGDVIGVILQYTGFLKDIWGLFTGFFSVVESFICRVVSGPYDACNDFNKFPDARRWDAATLAGLLVDEIRSDEGWDRDDPRAEFCYKALLSSPAFMDLGRVSTKQSTMFEKLPVNFIGSVYERSDRQYYHNPSTAMIYDFGDIYGWDGAESKILDTAQYNSFGCQNWDRLRHANFTASDKCTESGKKCDAAVEAQQIKFKFDQWVQYLKVAANDPTNLQNQDSIPGWNDNLVWSRERTTATDMEFEFVMFNMWKASDSVARLKVLEDFLAVYNPPQNEPFMIWCAWNQRVYEKMAKNPSYTASDWWDDIFSKFPTPRWDDEQRLAWTLQSIGGSQEGTDLYVYWRTAPKAMFEAAQKAKGLPYGPYAGFAGKYSPPVTGPFKPLGPPLTHLDPLFRHTDPVDPKSSWGVAIRALNAKKLTERQTICAEDKSCSGTPRDHVSCFNVLNAVFWDGYPGENNPRLKQWLQAKYTTFTQQTPALQALTSWAIWSVPYDYDQRTELASVYSSATSINTIFPEPSGQPPSSFPPVDWAYIGVSVELPLPEDPLKPPKITVLPFSLEELHHVEDPLSGLATLNWPKGSKSLRHVLLTPEEDPLENLIPVEGELPNTTALRELHRVEDPLSGLNTLYWPKGGSSLRHLDFDALSDPFEHTIPVEGELPLLGPFKPLEPYKAPPDPFDVLSPVAAGSWKIAVSALNSSSIAERAQICGTDATSCDPTNMNSMACFNQGNGYWSGYPGATSPDLGPWLQSVNTILSPLPSDFQDHVMFAMWAPPYNATQLAEMQTVWNVAKTVGFSKVFGPPPSNFPNVNWGAVW